VVGDLTERFRCRPEELTTRIESLQEEIKKLQQQLKKGASSDLAGTFDKLLASATKTGDVSVLVGEIPGGPDDAIRTQVDRVKQKAGSCVVVVGWIDGDKVGLLAAVSDDVVKKASRQAISSSKSPQSWAAAAAAALIWPGRRQGAGQASGRRWHRRDALSNSN